MRKNLKTSQADVRSLLSKWEDKLDTAIRSGENTQPIRAQAKLCAVSFMAQGLTELSLGFDKLAQRGMPQEQSK